MMQVDEMVSEFTGTVEAWVITNIFPVLDSLYNYGMVASSLGPYIT